MIVVGIILGFLIGLYLYKINLLKEESIAKEDIDKNNIIAERKNTGEETLVNNTEVRITPNTKITEKTYYKKCKHIITTEKKPEEKWVNLNEEEFKEQNNNLEIQKFTQEEIIIYQENEGFCNEHYLLKDVDGNIEIYILDEKGEITKASTRTEIPTEFLPEKDRENLKEGIKVYTKKELNKIIEDFE